MLWAIKLGELRYVIEHLSADRNVWSDMLATWAAAPCNKVAILKVAKLMYALITPSSTDQYKWPLNEDIKEAQGTSSIAVTKGF